MNGLEEIQKIINNFIDESKQAKQKISQIENERNILAQIEIKKRMPILMNMRQKSTCLESKFQN